MPVDLAKSIEFVRKHGDIIENARLEHVLQRVEPSGTAVKALQAMQNADGGFAYWLSDPSVSTVCDTVYVLAWLDDLSLRSRPVAERAVAFVLTQQNSDGGWDEVPAVWDLNPPEFLRPGEQNTRVWLTAYCAHRLMLFGYADTPECRACPIRFLLEHQDDSGRLRGYLRATWDALPAFGAFPELSARAADQALKVIDGEFSPAGCGLGVLISGLACEMPSGCGSGQGSRTHASFSRSPHTKAKTGWELGFRGRRPICAIGDRRGVAAASRLWRNMSDSIAALGSAHVGENKYDEAIRFSHSRRLCGDEVFREPTRRRT